MNKKAFSPTDVVIYVLAIFFGALILFYGYNSINSLVSRGEKALFIKFQTKLNSEIAEISALPGTVRMPTFILPAKFNKICFFDFGKPCLPEEAAQKNLVLANSAAVICDSVNDRVANIFLFPMLGNDMKISGISIAQNPLCLSISGFFKLKVTGTGRSAVLDAAPRE